MALIPDEIISQVLDRCDIVEIVSSCIPLKRAGRNFKALCPFHNEKTPSFVVNPEKQIFHCFGCGAGGNTVSFVMRQEHLEFPAAIRMLAEKAGITIPSQGREDSGRTQIRPQLKKVNEGACGYFHHNLLFDKGPAAKAAREYLESRKITLEMVKKFHLGFALDQWDGLIVYLKKRNITFDLMEKAGLIIGKTSGEGFYDRFRNRIMFPIFDVRRECVAFGGRTMEDGNPAKYINSPETVVYTKGHHLYGFHLSREAVGQQDFAIVVEGYTDFIMPFQAGAENIVASQGTALTVDQIRLLRRYTRNVVMLFDSDQAGESATLRSLELLIEEEMHVKIAALILPCGRAGLPAGRQACPSARQGTTRKEDPDSFIRRHGIEEFNKRIQSAAPFFEFKMNILMNKYDTRTIEGRARVSEEMLTTISKFNNAVVKSGYIKRLAQGLVVSEGALLEELRKIEKGISRSRRSREEEGVDGTKTGARKDSEISYTEIRPIERNLLRLMLEEKEFIPLTRSQAGPSDFKNEQVRGIVVKIFELFDQGRETTPSVVMSCCDDPKMLQTISYLMASEDLGFGDKKRIHQDCLERLKNDRLKSQRRDILHQMESAIGDERKLDDLKQQFNRLIKGSSDEEERVKTGSR